MSSTQSIAVRRLLAFTVDWFVVLVWGAVLFGVVTIVTNGNLPQPTSAWQAQGIGLLAMTLPITLYFAVCEASPMRASLGKRCLGLVISGETGGRLSFGAALARNAIKFVPWELGHVVAHQAVFSADGGLETWGHGAVALAGAVPCWWLAAMLRTGRAPYDRWTKAWVTRADDPTVTTRMRSIGPAASPRVGGRG